MITKLIERNVNLFPIMEESKNISKVTMPKPGVLESTQVLSELISEAQKIFVYSRVSGSFFIFYTVC